MDVTTRWNSTYQMFDGAFLYCEAFQRLNALNSQYTHLPTSYEWSKIDEIKKNSKTISNNYKFILWK
jgi:hypothetical protein